MLTNHLSWPGQVSTFVRTDIPSSSPYTGSVPLRWDIYVKSDLSDAQLTEAGLRLSRWQAHHVLGRQATSESDKGQGGEMA